MAETAPSMRLVTYLPPDLLGEVPSELVVDWHHGNGLLEVITIALIAVLVPTMLLWRRGQALADWHTEWPNRLLGLAIACAWIGFFATGFIDHSYVLMSWTAYIGALVAIPLAALAVKGIYQMRAWGLWAVLGEARQAGQAGRS